jgi:hypothetical protein
MTYESNVFKILDEDMMFLSYDPKTLTRFSLRPYELSNNKKYKLIRNNFLPSTNMRCFDTWSTKQTKTI